MRWIEFSLINPKFGGATNVSGGTFLKGPTTFMVTDELVVKPLSPISVISLVSGFNIPFSDLEELTITVYEEEVRNYLGVIK